MKTETHNPRQATSYANIVQANLTAAQKLSRYVFAKTPAIDNIPEIEDILETSPMDLLLPETCPVIPPEFIIGAFSGARPEDLIPVLANTPIRIWLILFVFDSADLKEVSALAKETVEFFRGYCAGNLKRERPAAMENVRRQQDLFPCIGVLANNDKYRQNLDTMKQLEIASFPLLLALDGGVPVRQHVGELGLDAMREFLDRVPSWKQEYAA